MHWHDVDGSSKWCSIIQKVWERFPKIPDSGWDNVNFDRIQSVLRLAGFDDNIPAYIRAIQGHCSSSIRVIQKHDQDSAWMDECDLSFKFRRQNSVEWTDCRRNRQEGRQTSMLLLGCASSEKPGSTCSRKLETTDRSLRSSEVATNTTCAVDLVKAQDMGPQVYNTFSHVVVHFWRYSSRMSCKSCRRRPDYLL